MATEEYIGLQIALGMEGSPVTLMSVVSALTESRNGRAKVTFDLFETLDKPRHKTLCRSLTNLFLEVDDG